MSISIFLLFYHQRLLAVLDELESLKPEFHHHVNELNELHGNAQFSKASDPKKTFQSSTTLSLEWPATNNNSLLSLDFKLVSNGIFLHMHGRLLRELELPHHEILCLFFFFIFLNFFLICYKNNPPLGSSLLHKFQFFLFAYLVI